MRALALVAALAGCASHEPPRTVIVERPVYVYVPEKSGPPVPPGEGIAPSPLLVEAEQRRAEHEAELVANEPRAPEVVYVASPGPAYYREPVYIPTPSAPSVVIVRDLPRSQRGHDRWYYDRHAKRCEERGTKWSRERCLRGVARK